MMKPEGPNAGGQQGYFHAIPRQPDCLQSCEPGGHTIALGRPNLVDGDYYAKGAVRGLHAFLRATEFSEQNTGFEMLGHVLEQFAIMGQCLVSRDCDNYTRTQIAFNFELAKTHVAHLLADEALACRLIRSSVERECPYSPSNCINCGTGSKWWVGDICPHCHLKATAD